jgi:putative transposase
MHPSIPSPCRLLSLCFECLALYIPFLPQVQAIFVRDRSQFTAEVFTDTLRLRGITISMDGKGRWMDNVFIERLWKSVKYEDIYLKAYGSTAEAKKGLATYFMFYNERRWHQNFDRKTPSMIYFSTQPQKQAAA